MAINSSTIGLLVEKANFEPGVAVAIAEAMQATIASSDLVTVAVLDARLAEFYAQVRSDMAALRAKLTDDMASLRAKFTDDIAALRAKFTEDMASLSVGLINEIASQRTDMAKLRAELVQWVFLVMLGNVALACGATMIVNALQR